jgi:16S rRNA C1402 (ribose-2'-O) methylase RsmI
VAELAEQVAARDKLKGEVVLLVGPPPARERAHVDADEVRAAVEARVALGESRSAAARQVAAELGVSRSEAYEAAHKQS